MIEKRKDKKGRILRDGESQRKDGRYMYRYRDVNDEVQSVYSWRLDRNDLVPRGKKFEMSLRDMEKQIAQDMFNGIISRGGNVTVVELAEKYTSLKTGVRHSTLAGYKMVNNMLKREDFGKQRIDRIKLSDAKRWLITLQKNGKGYSTIHVIRGVLRPAFQMAVNDRLLISNPFDFPLSTVIINDSVTREAISHDEERRYMEFVKNDKHFSRYYDGIYILLHTGLRISEFIGLTINDIRFDEMQINVDHQLIRTNQMEYIIEEPKTSSGKRLVPMSEEVAACFKRIIKNRPKFREEPTVDGVSGFLFFDKNGRPMVAMHWEKYMQHIVEKYNGIYKQELPKITPHVLRHTFCSRMANTGMSPKTLQYIMGHSDISVTFNTYTHISSDEAQKEFNRVCEVIPFSNGRTDEIKRQKCLV